MLRSNDDITGEKPFAACGVLEQGVACGGWYAAKLVFVAIGGTNELAYGGTNSGTFCA